MSADGHYRLSVKIIGRSAGHSAVAAAAYRSGEKLQDERLGITQDYSRKQHVTASEIITPRHAPEWMMHREKLWNAVEKTEIRKDAQLAREVVLSLPRELQEPQRMELVKRFVTTEFVSKGMVADVSFHTPKAGDGGDNPHAHVMLTMRNLSPEGFGQKNREWNTAIFTKDDMIKDKNQLVGLRATWAHYVNDALTDSGSSTRVSHLSNEAQGARTYPINIPFTSYQIQKRGVDSDIYVDCLSAKHRQSIERFQEKILEPKTAKSIFNSQQLAQDEFIKKRRQNVVDSFPNSLEPTTTVSQIKRMKTIDHDHGIDL